MVFVCIPIGANNIRYSKYLFSAKTKNAACANDRVRLLRRDMFL